MPVDIQATGFMGLAFETTAGTYIAPTKFFPIRSETLKYQQDTQYRRLIRGIADELGGIAGYVHIEGDIVMECLPDVLPYFLHASRNTVIKTGTTPLIYTTTPKHGALPTTGRTLSLTVVRDGVGFGYTGCVVGGFKIGHDNGALINTFTIFGRGETNQTVPATPVYSTQGPFGAGMYNMQIPTSTQVFDVQTFEFTVNDNPAAEYRLATNRDASYVRFGQREVGMTMTRDFVDRTEYDAFKVLTAQSVNLTATNGANAIVTIKLPNALKDDYTIDGLADQGNLVTTQMTWKGEYDAATSKSYEIVCSTTESIT